MSVLPLIEHAPAGSRNGTAPGLRPATALKRIAILGNHLPRQCGIATFTTDLGAAMTDEFPALDTLVVAMNDAGRRHTYPSTVRFEIEENEVESYRRAVDFLNVSTVDVVSLQHEYGIFGGKAGALILPLLAELRMPIVTTLHTILATPDATQRRVMDEVVRLSERLVVMSEYGAQLLQSVHGVPPEKIDLIPHGIPESMLVPGNKDRLGMEGRSVILTFGLLSPDKGIEYVVDALPDILAAYPDTVYVVLGATHPHVLERAGESYRLMLEARAQRLGVDGNIIFHNRFVSRTELGDFLSAADIYVTPYLNLAQITSGTLAYAVGTGKAVVSTPYHYAAELLDEDRGVLVPPRDSGAIARAIIALRRDPQETQAMRARASTYGREMAWGAVARRHVASMELAVTGHAQRRRTTFQARTLAERPAGLPEITLDHLQCLTDDTGILQHALFVVPRYSEGYCLDDNARALMLMVLLEETGAVQRPVARTLTSRYLAFVAHALDTSSGRFRNFLTYGRTWAETAGSDDSHGRALWALGTVVGRASDPGRRGLASDCFHLALPEAARLTSPRAWAYALLGIAAYLRAFEGDSAVQAMRSLLTARLMDLYDRVSNAEWPWLEESVTYCNARIPQALMVSGAAMQRTDMIDVSVRSLRWLVEQQRSPDGYFAPIGSNGFLRRGGVAATFDQQPVEACGMVSACHDAWRVTDDPCWTRYAHVAFQWFLGENSLHQPVHDVSTGGCRDGVHADRLNENQGAESTISYLLALRDMRALARPDLV